MTTAEQLAGLALDHGKAASPMERLRVLNEVIHLASDHLREEARTIAAQREVSAGGPAFEETDRLVPDLEESRANLTLTAHALQAGKA